MGWQWIKKSASKRRALIDFGTVDEKCEIPRHTEFAFPLPTYFCSDGIVSDSPVASFIERTIPRSYQIVVQTDAHGRITYASQDLSFCTLCEHLSPGNHVEVDYIPGWFRDTIIGIREPHQSTRQLS